MAAALLALQNLVKIDFGDCLLRQSTAKILGALSTKPNLEVS
jgi:hypothetical protein